MEGQCRGAELRHHLSVNLFAARSLWPVSRIQVFDTPPHLAADLLAPVHHQTELRKPHRCTLTSLWDVIVMRPFSTCPLCPCVAVYVRVHERCARTQAHFYTCVLVFCASIVGVHGEMATCMEFVSNDNG